MNQITFRSVFIIICVIVAIFFIFKTQTPEGFRTMPDNPRCPNLLVQKGSKIYLYNNKLSNVPGVNPIVFNNLEEYTEFLDWQRSQGIRCPVLYLQEVYDASGKRVCKARPCVMEPQGGLPPANATTSSKGTNFNDIPNLPGVNNVAGGAQDMGGSTTLLAGESEVDQKLLEDAAQYAIPGASEKSIDPSNRYPNLERKKLVDSTVDDKPYNSGQYPSYDSSSFYHGVHTPLDQLDVIAESKPFSPNPMDPNWGGKQYTEALLQGNYYRGNEVLHYP